MSVPIDQESITEENSHCENSDEDWEMIGIVPESQSMALMNNGNEVSY